jgi:non-specific serine/threonine protein kinase
VLLALATAALFAASVVVWLGAVPRGAVVDVPVGAFDGGQRSGDSIRIDAWLRAATVDAATGSIVPPEPAARTTPAAPVPRTATLRLAVAPWAEVWVDGVKRGVTPPTTTLTLAPGTRVVELRNPASEPVVRRIDAKAGQTVDVAHRFGAREGGR